MTLGPGTESGRRLVTVTPIKVKVSLQWYLKLKEFTRETVDKIFTETPNVVYVSDLCLNG